MVVGGSTGAGKSTLVNSLARRGRERGGRAAPDDARARARVPSGRRALVRRRPDPARPRPHDRRGGRPGRPRARADGAAARGPGAARRAGHRLRGRGEPRAGAASCWRPPTPGSSSRPRRATPTPCRGTSSRAARERGTALSLVLDRVPPEAAGRDRRAPAGDAGGARPRRHAACSSCPRRRSRPGACPPPRWRRSAGWLDQLAADAQARAGLVRRTLTGALESVPARGGGRPRRARRAGGRGRGAARRGGARVRQRRSTRSTRRSAAARCCAARCSRAGTTSSARATSCGRSRRGSAACATGCARS